jgi:hypothetical protein
MNDREYWGQKLREIEAEFDAVRRRTTLNAAAAADQGGTEAARAGGRARSSGLCPRWGARPQVSGVKATPASPVMLMKACYL